MKKTKIFGTDGIRDHNWTGFLEKNNIIQLGHCLGYWVTQKFVKPARILIGHDPRYSSPEIVSHLLSSLLYYPVTVHKAGMVPTPVIAKLTKEHSFDLGIMVTASHNDASYNGIKLLTAQGKLSCWQEEEIETLFFNQTFIAKNNLGRSVLYKTATKDYIKSLTHLFPPLFLKGSTIIVDCAQGAQSMIAPQLLTALGAQVLPIAYQPNGSNINQACGTEHLESALHYKKLHQADFALAFDGDGDRIVIIDQYNNCFDGDDILALLLHHKKYQKERTAIGTIMSNQGIEQFCLNKNICFVRTNVGDKFVHEALEKYQCTLGAETSGHIIINDFSFASDGLYTALRCLEVLLQNKSMVYPLFKKFIQHTVNVPVKEKKPLHADHIALLIEEFEKQIMPGRLIIRYSGTEPILRVTSETEHPKIEELMTHFIQQLQIHLS